MTDYAIEAEIVELDNQLDEINDMQHEVDLTADNIDQLEKVKTIFDQAVDDGVGVSPATAQVAAISVEHICERIGIPVKEFVATEAFGSTAPRLQSTQLAIEGFTDTVKRAWDAIIKALQTIGQKIKELLARLFQSNERIAKTFNDIKRRLSGGGGTPKQSSLEIGHVARAFYDVDNKKVSIDQVLHNHMAFTKVYLTIADKISALNNALRSFLMHPEKGYDEIFACNNDILASIAGSGVSFKNRGEGLRGGPFVAGRFFEVEPVKIEGKTFGIEANFYSETISGSPDELPAMDLREVNLLLEKVNALLKLNRELADHKDKLEHAIDILITLSGVVGNSATYMKEDSKELRAIKFSIKHLQKTILSLGKTHGRIVTSLPFLNLQANDMALKYVNASIANWE